ncbi:FUSC family protein [Lacinutrix undariae]
MKKILIIIAFIAALSSVILAVTPLSNLALIPAIVAFLLGLIIYYISKKNNSPKKVVQYIFLLAIISISITIYKTIFTTTEIGDIEALEVREKESEEDSKDILEELDIDFEELDIDTEELDIDTEELEVETLDIDENAIDIEELDIDESTINELENLDI